MAVIHRRWSRRRTEPKIIVDVRLAPHVVDAIRQQLYANKHTLRWVNPDLDEVIEADILFLTAECWKDRPESTSPLWCVLRLGGDAGVVLAVRRPVRSQGD